jgi:serine O-acetyltransferase
VIQRGFDKAPLSHNKIPDINKEIFEYLIKRIAVLEHAVKTGDTQTIDKEDTQLEEIYNTYIKSMT